MTSKNTYDVAVIGGGHNGLTCAAYLARAGLTVFVAESRDEVGGAVITEEFLPGFRNSVYAYMLGLLHPSVIKDLELKKYGLHIIPRPYKVRRTIILPNGESLWLSSDPTIVKREIEKFSKTDGESWEELERRFEEIAIPLRYLMDNPPPDVGGGWASLPTLLKATNKIRKLSHPAQATLAELMTMSAGDFVNQWFEGETIKGDFVFEASIGHFASPFQAGSAYILLYYLLGQVPGCEGGWGAPLGGMGAITQAMRKSAEAHGAKIKTRARVREIMTTKGRAKGIVLADGQVIHAHIVAGAIHPVPLFLKLLDEGLLPDDFRRRIKNWRSASGSFRMNVALSELPEFTAIRGTEDEYAKQIGAINITPSLDYCQRAYDDARIYGYARQPAISMRVASLMDDTLAPPGLHVMNLFCQHFNPELPNGESWDDKKEAAADLIVDVVNEYAPNFKRSIIGRQIKSPLDIERDLNMIDGGIFHGVMHTDQLYSLRPAAGYARYRSPVPGLYLCASGAHPGGGVTGLPGRNSARQILKDIKSLK